MINGENKMKDIKFRMWYPALREMSEPAELGTIAHGYRGINFADGVIEPMQYTGLKDKNGKEIYEGDLLISKTIYIHKDSDIKEKPCQVYWSDKLACFAVKTENGMSTLPGILMGWLPSVFEVIGNIYENKELLEV